MKSNNLEIEGIHVFKLVKQISSIYAGILNSFKFKNQTVFSTRIDKQNEDDQLLDENERYINLNINRILTQSDYDNNDDQSPIDRQIQNQKTTDSGWRFDISHSMTIWFYKFTKLIGSTNVKNPLTLQFF